MGNIILSERFDEWCCCRHFRICNEIVVRRDLILRVFCGCFVLQQLLEKFLASFKPTLSLIPCQNSNQVRTRTFVFFKRNKL